MLEKSIILKTFYGKNAHFFTERVYNLKTVRQKTIIDNTVNFSNVLSKQHYIYMVKYPKLGFNFKFYGQNPHFTMQVMYDM